MGNKIHLRLKEKSVHVTLTWPSLRQLKESQALQEREAAGTHPGGGHGGLSWVSWFPRAAGTKNHNLGGLNHSHLLPHSSGGWKCQVQVSAEVLPGGHGSASMPHLSPSFQWLLASFRAPWLIETLPHLHPHVHLVLSLCVSLHPNCPFYEDTNHIGLGTCLTPV